MLWDDARLLWCITSCVVAIQHVTRMHALWGTPLKSDELGKTRQRLVKVTQHTGFLMIPFLFPSEVLVSL